MVSDEKNKFLESVKGDISEAEPQKRDELLSYFVLGVFVALMAFCVIMMGMQRTKQNKLIALDNQIEEDVTAPLKSLENEQIESATILKQLTALNIALSDRTKFSQLLSDLKSNQYKKSLWSDFNIQDGTISISGKVDSYQDVAKAVAAMRNIKAVTDVKLSSAVYDRDSSKVTFMVTVSYDPSLYKAAAQATSTPQTAAEPTASLVTPTL